jgi:hypothetical protein
MDDYVIFKFYHIQHLLFSDAEISLNDINFSADKAQRFARQKICPVL